MSFRGQTGVEYLLLLGGAIVFITIVTLSTKDVIFPTGEQIEIASGGLATVKGEFASSPTGVIIPSDTYTPPTIAPVPSCSIAAAPINSVGPFSSTLTITFSNIPAGITQATVNCGIGADQSINIVAGQIVTTCNYPNVAVPTNYGAYARASTALCSRQITSIPAPAATCTFKNINSGTWPGTTNVEVRWHNLAVNSPVLLKCNQTDPGVTILLNEDPPNIKADRNCPMPLVFSDTTATAYSESTAAPGASCTRDYTINPPAVFPAPVCSISSSPATGFGPFDSTITATFTYLNPAITTASMACNSSDLATDANIDAAGRAIKICNYPNTAFTQSFFPNATVGVAECNTTVVDGPKPGCSITAKPSISNGPFSSIINVSFFNLETGVDQAWIRCNASTDLGVFVPIDSNGYATRTCYYPKVGSQTPFRVNSTAGAAACSMLVNVNAPGLCTITSTITSGVGPFSSTHVISFPNMVNTTALIKCNQSDPGRWITRQAGTFTRICPYPLVNGTSTFILNATIWGEEKTVSCKKTINVDTNGELVCNDLRSPVWKEPICNMGTRDFYEISQNSPNVDLFDSAPNSCNAGGGACLPEGNVCKIRAHQIAGDTCGQFDLGNGLFDGLSFKARTIYYDDGTKTIEFTHLGCKDQPMGGDYAFNFRFPTAKFVTELETGNMQSGNFPTFYRWEPGNTCHEDEGETIRYFIANSNQYHKPPYWNMVDRVADPIPDPPNVALGSSPAIFDLRDTASGTWASIYYGVNDPDSAYFNFSISKQTNPGAINCVLNNDRYIACDPAMFTGTSYVTIRVTDSEDYWVEDTFKITVGVSFDLPYLDDNNAHYNNIPWYNGYIYSLDNQGTYNDPANGAHEYHIKSQTGPYTGTCTIGTEPRNNRPNSVMCPNLSATHSNYLTVNVTDSNGNWYEDTMII